MFVTGALILLATAMQADTTAHRKAFAACLRETVTKAQEAKKAPADFDALARSACASQIGSFRAALVSWDTRAGRPRKAAETDADQQINDYITSASERLEDATSGAAI